MGKAESPSSDKSTDTTAPLPQPPLEHHDLKEVLEDVFVEVGGYGKFQRLLLYLIIFPACMPCALHGFSLLFMSETPREYHCWLPPHVLNLTAGNPALVLPLEKGVASKCEEFDIDVDTLEQLASGAIDRDPSWKTVPCKNGWTYDDSVQSSIVIDYDLVCQYDILPTVALAVLNTGSLMGVALCGYISDWAGRLVGFWGTLFITFVTGLGTAWTNSFVTFIILKFMVGLVTPANWQLPYVLGLEFIGPSERAWFSIVSCSYYTLGLILLSGLAFVFRDWRHLAYATSIAMLPLFIAFFFLPESPRWLASKGKVKKALKIMSLMAKVNGKPLSDAQEKDILRRLESSIEDAKDKKPIPPKDVDEELQLNVKAQIKDSNGTSNSRTTGDDGKTEAVVAEADVEDEDGLTAPPSPLGLFKTPNLRKKTLLIILIWFANQNVYIGLTYCGPQIGSTLYIGFFLSSAIELVAYVPSLYAMDHFGRRFPMVGLQIVGGFFALLTMVLPESQSTATMVCFLIAKMAVASSFLIIYPYAGELYPTVLRAYGFSLGSYIGMTGLIAIPFVVYLGTENLVIPIAIMGLMLVLGGLLTILLPETLDTPLPQSVEEAEAFGKNWSWKTTLMGWEEKSAPKVFRKHSLPCIKPLVTKLEPTEEKEKV